MIIFCFPFISVSCYAVWILHRNATQHCQDWKPFIERWRIKEYAFYIYPLLLKWSLDKTVFFSTLVFITITQADTCQKSHSTQGHFSQDVVEDLGMDNWENLYLEWQNFLFGVFFSTTLYMLCTKSGSDQMPLSRGGKCINGIKMSENIEHGLYGLISMSVYN